MAKKALIQKQQRKPKYKVQAYTLCRRCGRPRAVFRKFGLCRICLRDLAHAGETAESESETGPPPAPGAPTTEEEA